MGKEIQLEQYLRTETFSSFAYTSLSLEKEELAVFEVLLVVSARLGILQPEPIHGSTDSVVVRQLFHWAYKNHSNGMSK